MKFVIHVQAPLGFKARGIPAQLPPGAPQSIAGTTSHHHCDVHPHQHLWTYMTHTSSPRWNQTIGRRSLAILPTIIHDIPYCLTSNNWTSPDLGATETKRQSSFLAPYNNNSGMLPPYMNLHHWCSK